MSVVVKQMKAIRKLAVKLYDQSPEHFQAVITEIDLKLKEIEAQEIEYTEEEMIEEFDVRQIA